MQTVCRVDTLYHYLFGGEESLPGILSRGLLPLSAFPESERWQRLEPIYRSLYAQWAEPLLGPFRNSGVYFTPIDFRMLPGTFLHQRTRIAVPLSTIPADRAILTWELDGERTILPLSREALEQAAALWTVDLVRAWFARNPRMSFYYVPQVAVFPDGAIPVQPGWVERADAGA
ncbi:MAG: hypothetical protein DIU55_005550 [Bacillota bacterium]|nr:MAG: hypothetical protein DIU55_11475 [Bacillota bacterium]